MRSYPLAFLLVVQLFQFAAADEEPLVDLTRIDRSIVREPQYVSEPHYALVVLGLQAEHKSWLVMDGDDILYFDRNGNGDLTDPEDRIELEVKATNDIHVGEGSAYSGMNVFPIGKVHGVELKFHFWVRDRNAVPADEWRQQLLRKREQNNWENGTLWRIADDGSWAQNGTLLTATPDEAQITHFNGPLTFALKWGDRQRLEPWPKYSVFDVHVGTPGLPARNSTHRVFSPLTETEIPKDRHPLAIFQFPSRDGGAPIRQVLELDERCCGDTVLARMTVPREAGEGNANVSLSYVAWTDQSIAPAEFEVPVVAEPSDRSELSFIMFQDPEQAIGLDAVIREFRQAGISARHVATDDAEGLVVNLSDNPAFSIMLKRGDDVQETARLLGDGTQYADALSRCDSRFEVGIVDLQQALDEGTTLHRIQDALQSVTGGVVYNSWDERMTAPE